jgi:DNA helicase IV
MTLVGDIAQATGAFAPERWDDVLVHLPEKRPHRLRELTIGYRIPAQAMALAAKVLRVAAPALQPPTSVREGEVPPRIVAAGGGDLDATVVQAVARERDAIGDGNMAVICPRSLSDQVSAALDRAGIDHGRASRQGIDAPITVVPVTLVKGLELDAVVVVEPARIVDEEHQGMRALYVALTRATKRLTLVHERPLPPVLTEIGSRGVA